MLCRCRVLSSGIVICLGRVCLRLSSSPSYPDRVVFVAAVGQGLVVVAMTEVPNRVTVSAGGEVVGVEDLASDVGVFGVHAWPVAISGGIGQGIGGGFRVGFGEGQSQGHDH